MSIADPEEKDPARAAGWYGATTPSTSRRLGGDGDVGPKKPADAKAASFYGATTPSEKGGKVGGESEGGWYARTTPSVGNPTLAARARAKNHARRG